MANEKSLAVESMHRLLKHFGDFFGQEVQEGEKAKTLSDEVFDILELWHNRDQIEGVGLNEMLKNYRDIRDNKSGAISHGWARRGRSKYTTG